MTPGQKPYLNTREDAPIRFLGLPTLMRSTAESTNGSFGLMEHWEMPPGFASPYHMHHLEDEAFYVLEGEMAFVCDGKWMKGGPGTYVFGPREIPHGFKVVGSIPARMRLLCTPAGFESFVLELSVPINDLTPPDMAKLMAVAAKYQIDILGPLRNKICEEAEELRSIFRVRSTRVRPACARLGPGRTYSLPFSALSNEI
jgi:quercetin dioxygenase-like cupin family protein